MKRCPQSHECGGGTFFSIEILRGRDLGKHTLVVASRLPQRYHHFTDQALVIRSKIRLPLDHKHINAYMSYVLINAHVLRGRRSRFLTRFVTKPVSILGGMGNRKHSKMNTIEKEERGVGYVRMGYDVSRNCASCRCFWILWDCLNSSRYRQNFVLRLPYYVRSITDFRQTPKHLEHSS